MVDNRDRQGDLRHGQRAAHQVAGSLRLADKGAVDFESYRPVHDGVTGFHFCEVLLPFTELGWKIKGKEA